MSMRTIAAFAVAIFLGLVAVMLIRTVLTGNRPAGAQAASGMTPVVVAAAPIERGALLKPEMLKVASYSRDSVPPGAFSSIDQVIVAGQPPKVAMRELVLNEPVLGAKISGPGAKSNLAGFLAPGMRAVGLRSSDVAGVGGFVLPGDRVDVLVTRQVGTGEKLTSIVQVLADNALVLGVDQSSDADKPTVAKAVTVQVTPDQAQAISLAQSVGSVSLSLRQFSDSAPLTRRSMTVADLGPEGRPVPKVVRTAVKKLPEVRVTRGVLVSGYSVVD